MNAIINRLDRIERNLKAVLAARPLSDVPMGTAQAAKYLNVGEDFIYKLTSSKKLTHYKANKKIVIYKSDLDAYLAAGKVPSLDELADEHMESIGKST